MFSLCTYINLKPVELKFDWCTVFNQKPPQLIFSSYVMQAFYSTRFRKAKGSPEGSQSTPGAWPFTQDISVIKASGQRRRWCGQMKIKWSLAAWRQEGKGCKDLIDHLRVTLVSSLSSRLLARRFTVTPNLSYLRMLQTLYP